MNTTTGTTTNNANNNDNDNNNSRLFVEESSRTLIENGTGDEGIGIVPSLEFGFESDIEHHHHHTRPVDDPDKAEPW